MNTIDAYKNSLEAVKATRLSMFAALGIDVDARNGDAESKFMVLGHLRSYRIREVELVTGSWSVGGGTHAAIQYRNRHDFQSLYLYDRENEIGAIVSQMYSDGEGNIAYLVADEDTATGVLYILSADAEMKS